MVKSLNPHKKPTSSTLEGRWCSFGPYYAMFPVEFALNTISTYTSEGDYVFDPFCGRGTSVFSAEILNRHATGLEISKLGWIYSKTKIYPAPMWDILERLEEIYSLSQTLYSKDYKDYDEFFNTCYSKDILNFLIAAREELNWENDRVDRTLMAIIAINAHGKIGDTLSNQMQHLKACGPRYAVKWWKEKGFIAPEINPLKLISKKIKWRYAKGYPSYEKSDVYLGNSTHLLSDNKIKKQKYKLLFTSPPYYSVTDYHCDQWIRLWVLGERPEQVFNSDPNRNTFGNKHHYEKLLYEVFSESKKHLAKDAYLYIRTDAREYCRNITLEILKQIYTDKKFKVIEKPFLKRTQTALHGDSSQKPGEVDIILSPES